jgi:hypothetical protein
MGVVSGPRHWFGTLERGLVGVLCRKRRRALEMLEREAIGHIRALLRKPGCPICRGLAEAMNRAIFWFLYEGYYEEVWINQLCAAGGFCPSHFWALARRSGTWALSYIPQYLIEDTLDRLRAACRSRWRKPPSARDDCPTCSELAWWEEYLVRRFVIAWRNPEVRAAYMVADGLCRRHLRLVVAEIPDRLQAHGRSHAMVSVAASSELRRLAELVPTPMDMDQCPICATELATRSTVMQPWTAASDGLSPGRLAWEHLCALHEAWLMIAGLLKPGEHARVLLAVPQVELVACDTKPHRSRRGATSQACPLCALERQTTTRQADILVSRLTLPEERIAYVAGPGLCVRHFDLVVSKAAPDLQGLLADHLVPQLVTLYAELGEFFRKAEYRYNQEPRGTEQTAWRRAITRLVGGPELVFPGCGIPDGP